MQLKKFVSAWAAYVIVTFVLGFIWHLVLFKALYHELAIFSRIVESIYYLFQFGISGLAIGLAFGKSTERN
jgi:hypothetical protein